MQAKQLSLIHWINEYDRRVGVMHLFDDRFQKVANFELGQNLGRHSSFVAKLWPQGQARQEVLLTTLLLGLPWATTEDVGSKPNPAFNHSIFNCSFRRPIIWANFTIVHQRMSNQQRKLQKNNAKIDVTGKVPPRQFSSRPSQSIIKCGFERHTLTKSWADFVNIHERMSV